MLEQNPEYLKVARLRVLDGCRSTGSEFGLDVCAMILLEYGSLRAALTDGVLQCRGCVMGIDTRF